MPTARTNTCNERPSRLSPIARSLVGSAIFRRQSDVGVHDREQPVAVERLEPEGVPTYAEALWAEHVDGVEARDRIMASWRRRLGPTTRPPLEIDDAQDRSDDVTFLRSALALHALREHVGGAAFFGALQMFFDRHLTGSMRRAWGASDVGAFAACGDASATTPPMTDDELVQRVRDLRSRGRSPKQIAHALNVSPARVAPMVRAVARDQAASAPQPAVTGCWVSRGWSVGLTVDEGRGWPDRPAAGGGTSGLAGALVSRDGRRGHNRAISVCGYLVDTYCLGVKDALGPLTMDAAGLRRFATASSPASTAHRCRRRSTWRTIWCGVRSPMPASSASSRTPTSPPPLGISPADRSERDRFRV
jgi:hypothetical protein